jgi:hypothetical protein
LQVRAAVAEQVRALVGQHFLSAVMTAQLALGQRFIGITGQGISISALNTSSTTFVIVIDTGQNTTNITGLDVFTAGNTNFIIGVV